MQAQPTTSSPIRILLSSHRSLSLTPTTEMESGQFSRWAVKLVVIITLKTISWDRLRTAGPSHDVQTHDLRATAAEGSEVTGSNLQTSRIHLHMRATHDCFLNFIHLKLEIPLLVTTHSAGKNKRVFFAHKSDWKWS